MQKTIDNHIDTSAAERAELHGIGTLNDTELLGIVVGDEALAANILAKHKTGDIMRMNIQRLRMVEGMGRRSALQLAAAVELGRRFFVAEASKADTMGSPAEATPVLISTFHNLRHEEFWAYYLTSTNRVIERVRIGQGGVQITPVDVRLILKRALELLAVKIIVAHNHPSGDAIPSQADKELTRRLRDAAALLQIELTDHLIYADTEIFSMREHRML